MYKRCELILKELESEGKLKVWWAFTFPEKEPLELRLKDMLEDEVDEKYYLSMKQQERLQTTTYQSGKYENRVRQLDGICNTLTARDWKDPKCVQLGILDDTYGFDKEPRIYEETCPTLRSERQGLKVIDNEIKVIGNYMPSGHDASRIVDSDGLAPTVKENHGTVTATNIDFRIRKLTPKECWRLMRL